MKFCLELPDDLVDRIADAVAARIGQSNAASGPMLLGHRDVGVSPRTWRSAIKAGHLCAIKVGRELKAHRTDVDAWLAKSSPRLTTSAHDATPTQGDELDALLATGSLRAIRGGRS